MYSYFQMCNQTEVYGAMFLILILNYDFAYYPFSNQQVKKSWRIDEFWLWVLEDLDALQQSS